MAKTSTGGITSLVARSRWNSDVESSKLNLPISQDLKPFTASQMLVSNAEYLEFVEAGGYTDRGKKWWSDEGWRFVQDLGVEGPRFWRGKTHYRMLLEVIASSILPYLKNF